MSIKSAKYVLVTGPPGVGKTTLITKICNTLQNEAVNIAGFYTEEQREGDLRFGFDVVTLDGKRDKLSRTIEHLVPEDPKRFKVGQYYVFPNCFERLALPLFSKTSSGLLVLDEIGKMELFSKKFQTEVEKAFVREDIAIIATVPTIKSVSIPVVESLIANKNCKLFIVNKKNRNELVKEIITYMKT